MKKQICFLLALTILVIFMGPLSAMAEGDSPIPRVYVSDITATAGNTFDFIVYASDFDSVATLEVFAFYDPNIFTFVSSSTLSFISGAQTITNTENPGEASLYMISATGVSGSGSFWRLRFRVNANTAAGTYPITLAVGDACNTDLETMTVNAVSPSITVNSAIQEQKKLSFYSSGMSPVLYKGDSVTVQFSVNNAYNLSAADFELEYDQTLLRFENITLGSKLVSAQNALYSTNSQTPGYVKVSYAATSGVAGSVYPLISATFTVVAEQATDTSVGFKASGIYDVDLNPMIGGSAQYFLTIAEKTVAPTLPKISVGGFEGTSENFAVSVLAPGSTGLAAIDFVFHFNPRQISCTEVLKTADECFVIHNIDNENGVIKLSFICEDGINTDTEIAKLSFSTKDLLGGSVKLNVSGKNAVNANYEEIIFEYESPTFICHKLGASPTCTTAQICTICSKEFAQALGHDEIYHEAKEPTCVEFGWGAYYTCSRCDWSTYSQIGALGHTIVIDSYVEPTCTATGLTEGSHCDVCDEVLLSQEAIAALGHRVVLSTATWVDSIVFENDTSYPFVLQDGVYASTNKYDGTDSYFTITALYDCTLEISYSVSSEANYDKIIIRRNNQHVVEASGQTGWISRIIELNMGDIVTINYHKDGSVANGEDTGWFSFTCEQTQIGNDEIVPADEQEATCTEDVICSFCQLLIKTALGHDEVNHLAQAPTCTEIGWDEYVTCSRCEYSTYVEHKALGHSPITDVAIEPTCTETGLTEGSHCQTCQTVFVEQQVIDALGHRLMINTTAWVDSVEVLDDPLYPFVLIDGVYQSTNQSLHNTRSSATIKALYDCQLTINYRVSSESNYDRLTIAHNGNAIGIYSGEKSWMTTTLYLNANDTVTITYEKDVSVNYSEDTAYFYFSCPQTQIGSCEILPADEQDPTCTESVVCFFCNTVVKEALGHTWSEWHEIQAPACTATGIDERECSVCYTKETRNTESLGHDEIQHSGKAATCTEFGWKEYVTCSRCDHSTYEVITMLGHDEVFHPGKAPTCTEAGWGDYVTCTRCNHSTYVALSATGHSISGWIVDEEATYEKDGRKHKECFTCHIVLEESIVPKLSHKYESVVTPPTCTEQGYTTHTCSECGNSYVDDYLAALGHTNAIPVVESQVDATCLQDGSYDSVTYCSVCQIELDRESKTINKLGHDYSSEWTVDLTPGCTEKGSKSHHCIRCEDKIDITEIPANGHTWGGWQETKAPTCTATGTDERECSVCYTKETRSTNTLEHADATPIVENRVDATCLQDGSYDSVTYCSVCQIELDRESKTINKLGHDYSSEWTVDLTPGCTEKGSKSHHCIRCEDKIDITEIPANGHTWGGWQETKAPTCTATGTDERECSVCYTKETRSTNTLEHTNASPVVENQVNATCLQDGSYDIVTYCFVCQTELSREVRLINKLDHDEIQHSGKAATCTTFGWKEYVTCSRCDHSTYEVITMLGHNEVSHPGKAPTCTEAGWEDYVTCTRCNHSTYVALSATGHSVSGWIIDEEATYEKNGRKHKECSTCHIVLEESIVPMLSHKYASVITPPTCTEQGYTTHTCSECGNVYVDDYIPATGHAFDAWKQIQKPTCTQQGSDRRECTVCAFFEEKIFEALGHTELPPVVENQIAPTCVTSGSYDTVIYCSVCEEEVIRETKVLAQLGHSEIWHDGKAPTCTEKGWQQYVICLRCDYSTYVELLPTGHSISDWIIDEEATLESTGRKHKECTTCGKIFEETIIPILSHKYVSVVTPPTCTEQGYTTHTCSECGNSYVDNYIPALGHTNATPVVENQVDATCLQDGGYDSVTYCSACQVEIGREVKTINKLGHDYSNQWTVDMTPSCTQKGSKSHHCIRCGDKTDVTEVPASGHTWGGWQETKAPTCTNTGTDERKCFSCYTRETRNTAALGHEYSPKWVVDKEATCTTAGSKSRHCSRCFDKTNIIAIPANGHIDDDKSHICDTCSNPISICMDANKDHRCDYCVGYMGIHKAAVNGDVCEYCGMPIKNAPLANESEGLSGGAIAAIVTSSVAVAGTAGFSVVWFVVKKKTFTDLGMAIMSGAGKVAKFINKKPFTDLGTAIVSAAKKVGKRINKKAFADLGAKIASKAKKVAELVSKIGKK